MVVLWCHSLLSNYVPFSHVLIAHGSLSSNISFYYLFRINRKSSIGPSATLRVFCLSSKKLHQQEERLPLYTSEP